MDEITAEVATLKSTTTYDQVWANFMAVEASGKQGMAKIHYNDSGNSKENISILSVEQQ